MIDQNSVLPGTDLVIKVNNLDICYNDFGSGSIPIVFIHGFPFDKSTWELQLSFLKSDHRVIAYDIRGFGKSTDDSGEKSIKLFADDLKVFLDSLKIDKAMVCGLSMGGYIALNAVSRFPERFAGLILCDTQCIADTAEGKEKRYKAIELIEAGGLNDFTDGFVKNIFHKDSLTGKQDLVSKIEDTILSTPVKTITGTLGALANRAESCSSLGLISVPTLVLCGREDKITPVAQAEFLHSNIKNSILKVIENAGHMSNIEQSGVFNKHLYDFLLLMKS